MKILSVLILLMLFVTSQHSSARAAKIKVQEALRAELNLVLKATNDLHTACIKKDDAQIISSLKSLMKRIRGAQQKSVLAGSSQQHLVKILNAAQQEVEMTQVLTGKQRKTSLKNTFTQVVQLAQIFQLDKYRIFFCGKDRSAWLQKGWKPKNPVHPRLYPTCGKLVR